MKTQGGIFDYDKKKESLEEVNLELQRPDIWDDPESAQALGKEKVKLESIVSVLEDVFDSLNGLDELVELAKEDNDASIITDIEDEIGRCTSLVEELEFQRMFSGDMDQNSAFIDINSGSGGTEAQDWAEMLLRMYLRWADSHDFKCTIVELSEGEVAGIKSATIQVDGSYAFGWLRTETGVHRLVRKSPFDSGNRRHTSFASIFVYPEVDDSIEVNIDPSELRIDTYRASGAGGQHVNRTDSAVRITHLPTNTVVQCQSDRSQHKNKAHAMKQLKAKLYELELLKQQSEKQSMEDNKSDIGWGSQIRSYVLDQSRIKDLRTGVENTNTQAVLDGDLDKFMKESLRQGV